MKLRIKGNTIRIRLEKTEVDLLKKNGEVSDSTEFPGVTFEYRIVTYEKNSLSASFEENVISIHISEIEAKDFCETDRVGIEAKTGKLSVLIEKDFQCLHKRPGEDEVNMYENPLAKRA